MIGAKFKNGLPDEDVPIIGNNVFIGTGAVIVGKIKVGNREMTKEEYQQYLDFQRANPQIDWGADAMFTGYETQTVSTVPTPLRPRR